jgi:5-methylcytosine-specific restriction enzyme B
MSDVEPQAWAERMSIRLRGVLEYLERQGGSASRNEVIDYVGSLLTPNEYEQQADFHGRPKWSRDTGWQTTNLVKAGWLLKDGTGTWAATDAGLTALRQFTEPGELFRESQRLYQEWRAAQPEPARQRAWLVRGSSVLGTNLVPEWLRSGFCSLAASQLGPLEPDASAELLREQAAEDYSHLAQQIQKSRVDEILSFVMRIAPGDLVLTSTEGQVFVGDVTGEIEQVSSDGGRSNLRRAVIWRNADAPIDYADLPAPLPAALQSNESVVDLTESLALIDSLGGSLAPGPGAPEPPAVVTGHGALPVPSARLADALFVDRAWLSEVRDLLDERRQVIFYGPPGTGKTYIARQLAADLVGPEQVRLVQFHPAYTYEDFFEGYRPAAGTTEGTIGFELRPGPFRQLVNTALEHPDQTFVLIIDEINRANLAKVFGELYFLLEYRDEAIDLLYSAAEKRFTLPRNIYLIGTMNTADRSIALIDSAMRRRFAFVELSPDTEPTRSLLRRWSIHHGLGTTAADLLDALNARIEDPDFRVGPSYFMTSTARDAHSHRRIERIWRSSIEPLLHEHHYGEWAGVRSRYALSALLGDQRPSSDQAETPRAAYGDGTPHPGNAPQA